MKWAFKQAVNVVLVLAFQNFFDKLLSKQVDRRIYNSNVLLFKNSNFVYFSKTCFQSSNNYLINHFSFVHFMNSCMVLFKIGYLSAFLGKECCRCCQGEWVTTSGVQWLKKRQRTYRQGRMSPFWKQKTNCRLHQRTRLVVLV